MRFFDREYEVKKLREIEEKSHETARFTIVTGRRRIGKTSLIMNAYKDRNYLYFFVGRKSESDLCEDFQKELEEKLGIVSFGRATRFADIFKQILVMSKTTPVTLVIDEFQDFLRVNVSVFSDMQKLWDLHKSEARMNLIVCGSIYRLMNKIFKDAKEPLYGRQTDEIKVLPFTPSVMKEILAEYNPGYTNRDLLALFSLTGGVAKYVEHFIDNGAFRLEDMLSAICCSDSMYVNEGKITLVEEFGKEYSTYFSILTAIAQGHTQRSDIEAITGKEIGGYLTKLEDDYGLIRRHQPLFESKTTTNVRYELFDNFFIFWFRFIYKYGYMLEIKAFGKLREVIERDYDTFSGKALERYFKQLLMESGRYTRIGSWWNRKGTVDIDIIAEDEFAKTAEFYEVKLQEKRYDPVVLEERKDDFLKATKKYGDYKITCSCLSLEDM